MVRCRKCGALLPGSEYAAHIPCEGPDVPSQPAQGAQAARPNLDPLEADNALTGHAEAPHKAPRLDSARGRVLHLLLDRQWHTSPAICDPAVGGSEGLRRLRELRAEGWWIEKRRATAGLYEYRLRGMAQQNTPNR